MGIAHDQHVLVQTVMLPCCCEQVAELIGTVAANPELGENKVGGSLLNRAGQERGMGRGDGEGF